MSFDNINDAISSLIPEKNRDDFNNTFTDFANRIIRVTN